MSSGMICASITTAGFRWVSCTFARLESIDGNARRDCTSCIVCGARREPGHHVRLRHGIIRYSSHHSACQVENARDDGKCAVQQTKQEMVGRITMQNAQRLPRRRLVFEVPQERRRRPFDHAKCHRECKLSDRFGSCLVGSSFSVQSNQTPESGPTLHRHSAAASNTSTLSPRQIQQNRPSSRKAPRTLSLLLPSQHASQRKPNRRHRRPDVPLRLVVPLVRILQFTKHCTPPPPLRKESRAGVGPWVMDRGSTAVLVLGMVPLKEEEKELDMVKSMMVGGVWLQGAIGTALGLAGLPLAASVS